MKLIKYADREMLAIELANRLLDELKNSLLVHSEVCFVVPGGTTPGPIFDILCAAEIEWDRVHLFLSDERWVPENHNRSNTRVIKERFLIKRAAAAQFVPFYMPGKTPATASPILSEILANKMPISLLLLGMGVDMHTASLFPNAVNIPAMLTNNAPLIVPVSVIGQEPRISLSGRALKSATNKHLVISGADKLAALEIAQEQTPVTAPVATVLDNLTVHWAE